MKIDLTNLDDIITIQKFTETLMALDIKSAEDTATEVDNVMTDDFCHDCMHHNDDGHADDCDYNEHAIVEPEWEHNEER